MYKIIDTGYLCILQKSEIEDICIFILYRVCELMITIELSMSHVSNSLACVQKCNDNQLSEQYWIKRIIYTYMYILCIEIFF